MISEEMKATFEEFDLDGDGHITGDEFREAMFGRGEEVTDEDLSSIFERADGDGDGKINLEEFSWAWNA